MKSADMSRMANQMADFFASYPPDEAAAMVADHIRMFWAPQMSRDLARMLDEGVGDLNELARAGARIVADADAARSR